MSQYYEDVSSNPTTLSTLSPFSSAPSDSPPAIPNIEPVQQINVVRRMVFHGYGNRLVIDGGHAIQIDFAAEDIIIRRRVKSRVSFGHIEAGV